MLMTSVFASYLPTLLQVFHCFEPNGYEVFALLPGVSIDDVW